MGVRMGIHTVGLGCMGIHTVANRCLGTDTVGCMGNHTVALGSSTLLELVSDKEIIGKRSG